MRLLLHPMHPLDESIRLCHTSQRKLHTQTHTLFSFLTDNITALRISYNCNGFTVI